MADSKEEISLSYELDVKELIALAGTAGIQAGQSLKQALSTELFNLSGIFSTNMQTAINNFVPQFETASQKLSSICNQMGLSVQTLGAVLVQNLGPKIDQVVLSMSNQIPIAFGSAIGFVEQFISVTSKVNTVANTFKTFSDVLKSSKGAETGLTTIPSLLSVSTVQALLFIGALVAISTVVALIVQNWGPISAFFQNLWNTLQAQAKVLGTWFTGTFLHYFQDTWNNIKAFVVGIPAYFTNLWSVLTGGMTNLWNTISAVVKKMVQPLVQSILTPFTGLQTTFKQILTGVQNIFTGTFTLLKNVILGPILLICDLISGNFGKILPDLIKIFTNIQNALKQIWTGIQQYFRGVFTVIGTIFTSTWNGFVSIVTTTGTKIKTGITTLWDSIISWFRSLPATLMQIGAKMFESMKSGIDSTIHTVVSAVQTGIGQAIDWIKDLPHQALQWGKDIIGGIVDGIKSAADAVGNAVKGIAQDIRKFLHFSVPDEGPLVDFPTWMPDMMKGLASGILENKSLVTAALMDLAGAMSVGLSVTPALAVSGGGSAFAAQQQGSLFAAGISRPVIDYHPTFQSPKALSPVEIARQERQNAQRLSLFLRRR